MAETRIKGQEVSIRIVRGERTESTLTAISDFTLNIDMATVQQGYLGEKNDRFDDVFNGLSGSITMAAEGKELLAFLDFIIKRAQRDPSIDLAKSRVNAVMRLSFPNGQRPRVLLQDLKFDASSLAMPSRQDFVNLTLPWKTGSGKFITT